MNIIYKLTNLNKPTGKRFYIGSKTECKLLELNGVPTIYNVKTQQPYYGSSSCFEFKADMKSGHIFRAEILEVVYDRTTLRDRENHHLQTNNAVESDEFYNLSHAFIHTHNHTAVRNMYGEIVSEYAAACSQVSKRDGTAIGCGYPDFGTMYFDIHERVKNGESVEKLSKSFGKHRKWANNIVKPYNMEKAKEDLHKFTKEQVREFIINGASLKLAADRLGCELPAARVLLGDFNKEFERAFSVALTRGKSKEELEKEITLRVLQGEGFIEIGNSMTLCRESILRYFLRHLRGKKDILIDVLKLDQTD